MYASFFGLKQSPFSIAPDPRFLYMSERHREALAHLLYGVQGGGGFVLLSGEIGAGKTTVCRCFLEQVPAGCQVAYIFNPQLTVIELLQTVCDEFGIVVAPAAGPATVKAFVDALNAHLLAAHAQGRHCVLIIDEAQHLSAEVLEQLRLLTNLETNERKLLQIILIGQPELRALLAGPGLEQLAQRVIARYHLGPLSAPETAAYVAHRLAVGGLSGAMPFEAAALRRIHSLTGGVPRRINLLCDRALLGAFAEGQARVGQRIVERAASEVFDTGVSPKRGWRWPLLAGGAVAGLAVAVLLGAAAWALWGGGRGAGRAAGSAASAGRLAAAAPTAAASGAVLTGSAGSAAAAVASETAASGASASPLASAASAAAAATASPVAITAKVPAASALPPVPALTTGGTLTTGASAIDAPPLLPGPGLAVFPRDEQQAWRELAPFWGWQLAAGAVGDLCQEARAQRLRCYRTAVGTLAQLRQLDRPATLLLRVDDGQPHLARLVALDGRRAVLAAGALAYSVPLADLARVWRGEFTTLWRAPEGYTRLLIPGAQGQPVDALAQGLAAESQQPPPPAGQVLAGELAARLAVFQRAQGLKPDGIAGPTTFMQLNRALGAAEPRLVALSPER